MEEKTQNLFIDIKKELLYLQCHCVGKCTFGGIVFVDYKKFLKREPYLMKRHQYKID